jgi:hypothetical protein
MPIADGDQGQTKEESFRLGKKCFAERKVWFKLKQAWFLSTHIDPTIS